MELLSKPRGGPSRGWMCSLLHSVHTLLLSQWSEDICAAHLTQRDGYQATTQGQLKEQLYQEIIHYFDKGKVGKTSPLGVLRLSLRQLHAALQTHVADEPWCAQRQRVVTRCLGVPCALCSLALVSGNHFSRKISSAFADVLWKVGVLLLV